MIYQSHIDVRGCIQGPKRPYLQIINQSTISTEAALDKPGITEVTQALLEYCHYDYVIMTMLASQITSLTVVYSIVYSCVNQRKHQSSASLAFVWEIHRGPVNFPHKWPVTRKMFPFDDVIMVMELGTFHEYCNGITIGTRAYVSNIDSIHYWLDGPKPKMISGYIATERISYWTLWPLIS